ncbi:hypothetical protein VB712_13290 [Spirulina sp. CCNP1310]|uniref:hypothetical protein n=1 Tax=Spirulina sp. CCNP1310 TaxID=3110249 RepID=UPI002B209BED|nr:hypothetical protein [Spirulina sp. CCNP1310]MEA5420199.1 hypothetical protein [Spirulina sp. CCNP1310]
MTPKEQLVHELETAPETLISELLVFLRLAKMRHYSQTEQPLWGFIEELVADIPPSVLDTLPSDGAVEHDHYIYETPKPLKQGFV